LKAGDTILDIGCNDCTMLSFFPDIYKRIGVDPATNINWDSVDPSICIINDYFSAQAVLKATEGKPCRVVTSIAMLYSVEDVNTVVAAVKSILAPDGVWCIQLSYLPALIKNMTFYDVCHEHLHYFSLTSLSVLLQTHGLTIFDAATNEVNGGSLRVFVTHAQNQRAKTASLDTLLEEEKRMRLVDRETYARFFDDVCELKRKVTTYIRQEEASGHRVIGLGASTKGNVLLQFFGLDKTLLPSISERNPEKVGLRTLGTDIELISEEQARALQPSCMLVLIWFFKEELLKRERAYLQNGGKLLFPMPYCHVVTRDGEVRL